MESKKILLISPQPFFQWRGSPIRVAFDAQALAECGFEVDLLTLPIGEDRSIPGVRVLRVPNLVFRRDIPIGPSIWKVFYDLLLFLRGLLLVCANRYYAVHGIEDAGAIAVILARLNGARVIFEKHSDPASYRKGLVRNAVLAMYRRVETWTILRADAVIGTGPGLIVQAGEIGTRATLYHIPDIPSSLVDAEPEKVQRVRNVFQQEGIDLLVMYVGSFAVYQGIELLFEAMPLVLQRNNRIRFIVIGGSHQEVEERRRWTRKRGIEESVSFPGKIPPDILPSYLAAMDVLLSPRIAGENTPLKVLDYLKSGRPIVATNHKAHRQILDENCAVLVDSSPQGFAEGILRLASDPKLSSRLGEQSRALYEERYSYDKFKSALLECYRNLGKKDRKRDKSLRV